MDRQVCGRFGRFLFGNLLLQHLNKLIQPLVADAVDAFARVREEKPDQYLKVITSILPKDFNLKSAKPLGKYGHLQTRANNR